MNSTVVGLAAQYSVLAREFRLGSVLFSRLEAAVSAREVPRYSYGLQNST